ncbi:MAG: hypothetical protein KDB90_13705 [Planctomycetes bacterium]|nr:hypothetical protein [Planctomycetota bacterium]
MSATISGRPRETAKTKASRGSNPIVPNNANDDAGQVFEEDDHDLDLSDLHDEPPQRETVRERLQRAAKRRTTKQQEKNWHDTPVNVTPSGRHEIVEDEDVIEDDEDLDVGGVVITGSGRHEIVDEHDIDIGDLDESTLDANNYDASFPGPATRIEEELDLAGIRESQPITAGPMTMAAYDMEQSEEDGAEEHRHEQTRGDTERIVASAPEDRIEAGSGPMTMAAMEMAGAEGDDPSDDTDVPSVELTGASMGDSDALGGSGPMTLAASEMESNIAEDAGTQGDKVSGHAENPTGETVDSLIDNSPQRTDLEDSGAAPPAAQNPAAGDSNSAPEEDAIEDPTRGVSSAQGEESRMRPDGSEEDELDLNAAGDSGEITDNESDELDLGAAAGEEEDSTSADDYAGDTGDDDSGAVSEDSVPAEPNEAYSEQPEVSTVGDDSGAPLGRGLDVGTANLVASRMDEEGGIEFFPARNAFLDVPEDPYTLKMLKGQGVPYIKRENKLFIIGEDAFELANIFNREMRRPMKNGLISPTDVDAMPMEVELFKKILGPPRAEGEIVYYSIPADPVDSTMNIVYHTNIANGLLDRLGYRGHPFNEGQAVVFSELGDDDFTGIGISCGGGMVNVCVTFRSMPVVSFSTAKGGDWIDQQAAQVMGCAASKITAVKERGVDINAPKTPEEEAIVIYYRHLIKYSLDNIIKKFETTKDIPNFPKPVPIAISGGTSKVGGFVEVFKDEFSKMAARFPIKVSDIRRAEDQLNATSKGCLLAALSHED